MPPSIKGPASARRVRPLRESGGRSLTAEAIEELFRASEVLAEGSLSDERWYGSVMITFDLARVVRRCRGLESEEALAQFVEAVEGSVRVRVRAHRAACAEIYQRYPDRTVGTAELESRFERRGTELLLDIDVEAPLDVDSRREQA